MCAFRFHFWGWKVVKSGFACAGLPCTRLILSQVTTDELDAASKLLDKACQKFRGISDVPPQRITDLKTAIHQLRRLSCILDCCTIAASYELSQAQKALLMPRTATSSFFFSNAADHALRLGSDMRMRCKHIIR